MHYSLPEDKAVKAQFPALQVEVKNDVAQAEESDDERPASQAGRIG